MTFHTLLTHPAVQALGWALVHFVWQGTLLAVVLVLTNTLTRQPRIRYAIGCAAMLLMPVVFVATVLRNVHPAAQYTLGPGYETAIAYTPVATDPGRAAIAAPVASAAIGSNPLAMLPGCLVCAWLIGVLAFSLYTTVGWIRVRRLTRSGAEPVDPAWLETTSDLIRKLRISRPVRLYLSAIAEVPAVIGWIRPYILLPVSAVTGLDESQLRAVLAHELAHIRRHDYLVNLLQNAIETLLFYHPAVWWVSHRIRQEREHCCDDLAVEVCGNVMIYANALARLEELRGSISEPALAATGGDLLARIRRLTGQGRANSHTRIPGFAGAILAAALVVAAMIVTGSAPAIHAQSPPATTAQAAPTPPVETAQVEQRPPASTPQPELPPPPRPRFEVASIRPNLAGPANDMADNPSFADYRAGKRTSFCMICISGRHYDSYADWLKLMIGNAYRIDPRLVVAPDWVNKQDGTKFDIHALMPEGATREQVPDMLKTLLEERFHLVAHLAPAEQTAYSLVVAKNGPKLRQPRELDRSACSPWMAATIALADGTVGEICRSSREEGDSTVRITMDTKTPSGPLLSEMWRGESLEIHREYFSVTMPQLAEALALELSTGSPLTIAGGTIAKVVDRTGIAGAWDVVLDTTFGDLALSSTSASLEKLGLRLERTTVPTEKLIVDNVDKNPTEN